MHFTIMFPKVRYICNETFVFDTFKLVFGDSIIYSVVFGNQSNPCVDTVTEHEILGQLLKSCHAENTDLHKPSSSVGLRTWHRNYKMLVDQAAYTKPSHSGIFFSRCDRHWPPTRQKKHQPGPDMKPATSKDGCIYQKKNMFFLCYRANVQIYVQVSNRFFDLIGRQIDNKY